MVNTKDAGEDDAKGEGENSAKDIVSDRVCYKDLE